MARSYPEKGISGSERRAAKEEMKASGRILSDEVVVPPAELKTKADRRITEEQAQGFVVSREAVESGVKEDALIDANINALHEQEAIVARRQKEAQAVVDSNTPNRPAEAPQKTAPSELVDIYGDKVPSGVLEMYDKLNNPETRKSYVAQKAAEEKEKKARAAQATSVPKKHLMPKPKKPKSEAPPAEAATPNIPAEAVPVEVKPPQAEESSMPDSEEEMRETLATGTTAERSDTFQKFIARATDILDAREEAEAAARVGKEKSQNKEQGNESRAEYLSRRSESLNAGAEQLGSQSEGWVTKSLKKYNALNWKTKLAITASLLGVTVATALTMPASLTAMVLMPTLIAGQRAVGASGFMLARRAAIEGKIRENPEHSLANAGEFRKMLNAAGQATFYFALMGGATTALLYGAESALEVSGPAHAAVEQAKSSWLGRMLGHHTATPEAPVQPPHHAPQAEPAAAAAAGEVAAKAEVPKVYAHADASAGHGYEYMAKRIWEQLHDSTRPSKLPEGTDPKSDLARLFNADKASIDTVVHDIAKEHHSFRPDGASVRIDADMHMTIEKDGMIHLFNQHSKDFIDMPPEMHVIPGMHHDAAPAAEMITTPQPIQTIDLTQEQEVTSATESAAPVASEHTIEVPSVIVATGHEVFKNVHNISINPDAPAIYEAKDVLGEKILVAYGGTDEARFKLMQDFAGRPENQGTLVRWAHTVKSIFGDSIKVDAYGEQMKGGRTSFLLDFFQKPVELPSPEAFEAVIQK